MASDPRPPLDPPSAGGRNLRVLIVAEHASARFGGEAILPLHYFRVLRGRGTDVRLIAHSRTGGELMKLFPSESDRLYFIPDTRAHRLLEWLGKPLPAMVRYFSTGWVSRLITQLLARRIARRLVREYRIDVVHQPVPVSPRETSVLHAMGAPVVIGPMNGGMSYPPAFRLFQGRSVAAFTRAGRWASGAMNRLLPGKRRAAMLLVANERTRAALPPGTSGRVITLVENGIDPAIWAPPEPPPGRPAGEPVRFVFAGRLVDWKGVDLLLHAFEKVRFGVEATLDLLGDGPMRPALERQVRESGAGAPVRFHGWMAQRQIAEMLHASDVFVLPSLYECGGAVVMEAMAAGLPVVATNWGGPADYLDESCGILVAPTSRQTFIDDLASAMLKLARSPELRRGMGRAAREKALKEFDWEAKADRILEIYADAVGRACGRGEFTA